MRRTFQENQIQHITSEQDGRNERIKDEWKGNEQEKKKKIMYGKIEKNKAEGVQEMKKWA